MWANKQSDFENNRRKILDCLKEELKINLKNIVFGIFDTLSGWKLACKTDDLSQNGFYWITQFSEGGYNNAENGI